MANDVLLNYLIDQEKIGAEYVTTGADKDRLIALMKEVRSKTGKDIQYLAQLDNLQIYGIGEIVGQYIGAFESEFVKSCLLDFLVEDRIEDCGQRIYQMYLHFKTTDTYLSSSGKSAPLGITVRYDNAFKRLKPKKLKNELCALVNYPRDVFYLPLTMRMLASWKMPELEMLLKYYLDTTNITPQSVGLPASTPTLDFLKKEIRFTAIHGLRYYPSNENCEIISQFLQFENPDVVIAAKKTLDYMKKQINYRSGD